jgi:hypothetical protein
MGAIMLIVAVSRGLMIPVYLTQLNQMDLGGRPLAWLHYSSFAFLVVALCVGGLIIIGAMLKGHRAELTQKRQAVSAR